MNLSTQLPATSENLIKTEKSFSSLDSFFDHDEKDPKEVKYLWQKPKKDLICKLLACEPHSGCLDKKGKKTGMWIKRYYMILGNYLVYKHSSSSSQLVKAMELDRVRIEYIETESKRQKLYGFRFIKNREAYELFTKNERIYQGFKEKLLRLCIQVDFHQKYQSEKLIGKGSFGRVYLVKRISDGQKFASKMFYKDNLNKEKKGKATLLNEINILRALDHPGIMKLYEIHETSASIHVIVELLSGGELFEKIKERKNYKEKDCATLLNKMITPLIYLHSKGIMHRDLKPENLILRPKDNDYDIVIADFGLATDINTKTPLHIRCGTPGYCAPEILLSKGGKLEYDGKCDVYSLGCIFYHIVTGHNPFYSKNNKMVFYNNRLAEVNFQHPKIAYLSENGREMMRLLLTKDPKERPTFEEVLKHPFFTCPVRKEASTVLSQNRIPHNNADQRSSMENILLKKSMENIKKNESNHSIMTYGSFQVGRSNIFKGHVDTVPETGFLSPAVVYPEVTSPGMPARRSEFSRFSRFEAAVRGEPVQGKADSQSISINISIVKSDHTSNVNSRDEANISKSSRSRSLSKSSNNMSKIVVAGSEVVEVAEDKDREDEETNDSKREKNPLSLQVLHLLGSFKNPFEDYSNECGVYQRIEKMNTSSMPSKTMSYPKLLNTISAKFRSDRGDYYDTDSVASSHRIIKLVNMDSSQRNFV